MDNEKRAEKVKIDSFTEDEAHLSSDVFNFTVPKKLLPKYAKVGEEVVIKITSANSFKEEGEKLAKDILNEILQSSNQQ